MSCLMKTKKLAKYLQKATVGGGVLSAKVNWNDNLGIKCYYALNRLQQMLVAFKAVKKKKAWYPSGLNNAILDLPSTYSELKKIQRTL